MGRMQAPKQGLPFPEPLLHKPESPVGHHIERIDGPRLLLPAQSAVKQHQQHPVKDHLHLAGGPAQRATPWQRKPLTAAGNYAAYSRNDQKNN